MKFLKLFSSAFALASFLFSSGSFAASRLCDGVINDETVLEDIEVINGASCIINDSTVYGFIVGDDSPNTILIYKTNVENRIVIRGAQTVAISDVKVDDGNIVVVDSVIASVVDNRTNSGEIRVNRNAEAYVFQNDAEGRIVCRNNGTLEKGWNTAGPNGDQCRN